MSRLQSYFCWPANLAGASAASCNLCYNRLGAGQLCADAAEGWPLDAEVGRQVGERNTVQQVGIGIHEAQIALFGTVELKTLHSFLQPCKDGFGNKPPIAFKAGIPVVALTDVVEVDDDEAHGFQALVVVTAWLVLK